MAEKTLILINFIHPLPKTNKEGAAFFPLNPSCRAVRAEHWHQASAWATAQSAETKFSFSFLKKEIGDAKFKNAKENFVEA